MLVLYSVCLFSFAQAWRSGIIMTERGYVYG